MALACALPFRTKPLVLDEPFSGLDPLVCEEFLYGLLGRGSDEHGWTCQVLRFQF